MISDILLATCPLLTHDIFTDLQVTLGIYEILKIKYVDLRLDQILENFE
jgi:hypothetical protein